MFLAEVPFQEFVDFTRENWAFDWDKWFTDPEGPDILGFMYIPDYNKVMENFAEEITEEYAFYYKIDKTYDYDLTDSSVLAKIESKKYTSIANELQHTVATWYNTLRRIAIVGLLSVLVYVGIRIVITSSSQDKAKYKSMLKDWLVALCLLFTLHYIMSITLAVTQEISAIFSTGETDKLLNELRYSIFDNTDWGEALAYVIMYVTIVILTITYTIQYLKRVLYMAFYTLIAPLITLTYPLDKIKDGQAQAFTMWIREYIFTALIQVVHLIIYFVFVGSAMELVEEYWLMAIVVLIFMKKGEEMVKKMFGFNKSETVGTLGKAAMGGMIMNAMNKISHKSPKGGQAGTAGGSNNNVRTATNTDALSSIRNGGTSGSGIVGAGGGISSGLGGANLGTGNAGVTTANSSKPKRSIKGGAKSLGGKYLKKLGGTALRTALAAPLAGTGAIIGFAAGVSQGDIGAAFAGALAGGKAGYGLGGKAYNGVVNAPGNLRNSLNNVRDTWNEGAYGAEYASNEKFDREFRRSSTYKALKQKYGNNFSDESVLAILNAGITEQSAMDKILKNVTQGNGYSMEDAIGYYALTKMCKDAGVYYDDDKLRIWLEDQGFGQVNDVTQIRNHMKNF